MAIKIFGSGGGGSGSAGNAALGGLGGFLSGGPIGAGVGILSGLFGSGDQEQTTTYNYENLSGVNQRASTAASESLPALLAQLDPGVMDSFIRSLSGELEGAATTRVEDTFSTQRGAQRAAGARSGGTMSSVQNVFDTQSADTESKALIEAVLGSRLTAEDIGQNRTRTAQGSVNAATGVITGLDSTRKLRSQTGVQRGNTTNDMLSGIMGSLSDPLSQFNSGSIGDRLSGIGGGRYSEFINSILGSQGNGPGSPSFIGPVQ